MENETYFQNIVVENVEQVKVNAIDIAKMGGSSIFFKRWVATIIDTIILIPLITVSITGTMLSTESPLFFITSHLLLVTILIILAYYLLIEGLTGYTLGKLIMRIKVVNNELNVPGIKRGFIRSITRLVELNPFLLGGIPAGVCVLASKNKQRLGDMAAGTYVLNVRDFTVEKKKFPIYITVIVVITTVLTVAVLALGLTTSIANIGNISNENASKIIVSKDNNYQATFPRVWTDYIAMSKNNNSLNIYACNLTNESFCTIITTVKKEPNELSLANYETSINGVIDAMFNNSKVLPSSKITVNAYPAIQYEITGEFDNEKIIGYVTIVETPKAFHHIITWLPEKDKDTQNMEDLKTITNSFKEREIQKDK